MELNGTQCDLLRRLVPVGPVTRDVLRRMLGNVDDGKPLIADGGPKETRAIGGDEVSLFYACYVASHTDKRLFIADAGNTRILSVKIGYYSEEKISLKSVTEKK